MKLDPRTALNAMLRKDLPSFVARVIGELEPANTYEENWHHIHLAHRLEQVRLGDCRRLMINQPPRTVKTLMTSVAFPAWVLGHDPTRRIMCLPYSREVAQEQAILFRRVVTSDWYREIFPNCRPSVPTKLMDWHTDQGGYRLASSIEGSVLGRGADIIILDDPNKGQEIHSKVARDKVKAAYDNVISTRLDHPKESAIICVMQRLHQDDLSGHMREQEDWEEVVIAATAPEDEVWDLGWGQTYHRPKGELLQESRAGHAELELQKRKMGMTMFEAQYQQRPIPPPDGVVVKRAWLRYYDVEPEEFDFVLASWDTASTLSEDACWSVGTIWGVLNGDSCLLHVERVRLETPELIHRIEDIHRDFRVGQTIVEDGLHGRSVVQSLRRNSTFCTPIAIKPMGDKIARMQGRAVLFETGRVFLPTTAEWLATYLEELLGFPLPIMTPSQFAAAGGEDFDGYMNLNRAANDVLMGIPDVDQYEFVASFDQLPDDVAEVMFAELMSRRPAVEWASDEDVASYAKTPGGAPLVKEWGPSARENLAVVRARLWRVMDNLSEHHADRFVAWLDGLSVGAAAAVYRKLLA